MWGYGKLGKAKVGPPFARESRAAAAAVQPVAVSGAAVQPQPQHLSVGVVSRCSLSA